MKTFLHKKFKLNIKNLVTNKNKLLVAISSGQDSLCLLKLMHDCFREKSINIETIYIDHQWKKDSVKHIKHISNISQALKISINIYQTKNLLLSENEARKARYKIFIQHTIKNNCTNIVTGHNSNDQIETFLQNLFRGSSLNGTTSFTTQKNINHRISIIRPLINFTKTEIQWFCRLFCLPVWSDITNYNYYIRRNRLRHELIPYLKNYFNADIEFAISDFVELCREDNEYLRENSLKLYLASAHSTLAGINLRLLKKQHYALQKRVIQLYFNYHFNQQINTKLTELILKSNKANKVPLTIYIKNLTIKYYSGWLYACPQTKYKTRPASKYKIYSQQNNQIIFR